MYHSDNLIEIAELILQKINAPMHYKQLCYVLIDSELWDGRGKKNPAATIYTTLHNDIVKNKEDSAFRFMGDGIFCASTVKCIDQVCIPAEQLRNNRKKEDVLHKQPMETRPEYEQRIALHNADARCGNCKYIRYIGIQVLRMQRGSCLNYQVSQRAGVGAHQLPCDGYIKRSISRVRQDEEDKNLTLIRISKIGKKK